MRRSRIFLLCAVLATASCAAVAAAQGSRAKPARTFVMVRTPAGVNPTLQIRSATTGAVVKDLGPIGSSWTNNGFALSPDGSSVYLTLIGHRTLQIERVDVASGARTIIADGEQPAVSFDGRELAFAAGGAASDAVAVRDLPTGAERRIDLRPWIGSAHELMNSSIVWTRDGSAVLVLASHVAIADAGSKHSAVGPASSHPSPCNAQPPEPCLVEIHLTRSGPLRASWVTSIISNQTVSLVADGARPTAVFLESGGRIGSDLVQIALGTGRPRMAHVLFLPNALLVAVDRSGSRVMYLSTGNRPALWRGRISHGRLVERRKLIPNAWLEAISW